MAVARRILGIARTVGAALSLLIIGFIGGWVGATLTGGYLPFQSELSRVLGPGILANQSTPSNLQQQFGVFWEVWNLVEGTFLERGNLDRTAMIHGAITGMLASLNDPYTVYQEPELADQTREYMQGRLGGIGTYLRITDGRAYLWKPIKDAPAMRAGLQQDDEILRIDDVDVPTLIQGMGVGPAATEVAKRIRGEAGTQVRLAIQRGERVFEVTITREDVVLPSVEYQIFPNNVAYIRISEFRANTTEGFDAALRELLPQQPESLILDLRNNPGGFLQNAQEILGRLYDGVALYEEDGNGNQRELRTGAAPSELQVYDLPVVVLVNGGSASASEIVAGALRDVRPKTFLIGEKTFGKGSVQNIFNLTDGGSARITFAHWLTPQKSEINKIGITPQYVVPFADDPASLTPCVADRQPAEGQILCGDTQLFAAIRLLTTGETPAPAASR